MSHQNNHDDDDSNTDRNTTVNGSLMAIVIYIIQIYTNSIKCQLEN